MFGRGLNMYAPLCAIICVLQLLAIDRTTMFVIQCCYSMCEKSTRYNLYAAIVCRWLCYDVCYLMLNYVQKNMCCEELLRAPQMHQMGWGSAYRGPA